jgi:hypothetical protein
MIELLAKAPKGDKRISLLRHTLDVMNAAEWLFGSRGQPTRLGRAWLRFFQLPEGLWSAFSGCKSITSVIFC